MVTWFTAAALICATATVIPLIVGLRRMEQFESRAGSSAAQQIERRVVGKDELPLEERPERPQPPPLPSANPFTPVSLLPLACRIASPPPK